MEGSNASEGLVSTVDVGTINVQDKLACRYSELSLDDFTDLEEDEPTKEPTTFNYHKYSKRCCIAMYVLLAVICAGALAAVIVIGLVVGIPYMNTYYFRENTCKVLYISYMSQDMKCICGKGCASGYPCLIVDVTYTTAADAELTSQLSENGAVLNRQVRIGNYR